MNTIISTYSFIGSIFFMVLFYGCSDYELKNFNPDRIESQPEHLLKIYADTSLTLPRINGINNTRQQLDTLIYYAEWLKNYNKNIALFYAQKAYDIATEKNWDFPRAISAYRMAALKEQNAKHGEDIEDAIVDAKIYDRLFEKYDDPAWKVRGNILLGQLFIRKPDMDSANYYLKTALDVISDRTDDPQIINEQKAFIFHDLGTTHLDKDAEMALTYYQRSDSLYETMGNRQGMAYLRSDLGHYYEGIKEFSKADSLYDFCLLHANQVNDINMLAKSYQLKGHLNYSQFNSTDNPVYFEKATENLKNSLKYEYEHHSSTYGDLGATFHNSWFIDTDESHADSAIYYYRLAIIEGRKEGALPPFEAAANNLSIICASKPKVCETMLGKKSLVFINDNYKSLLKTMTAHSKRAYTRINKVEQRDIRVTAANKRRNQLFIGLGILGIAIAIFLLLYQRQQTRRLKAEMEALRAQINPHFISNSLNAIESLVNLGNAKAAAKYLVHFSRLSRQILNGSRSATTSLAEELKTLKHFLALEQLRFRDKLTFNVQVASDLNADLVTVPAMILQPYVENAIWHGIKPKQDGGHVQINVQKEDKTLTCEIEDNGVGREQSKAMRKASVLKHKSMGMQITEERLRAMGRIKGSRVEIQDLVDTEGKALWN